MADRYVIVIPSLTLGGAERQALAYAQHIRDAGIGVPVVVGLGRRGALADTLDSMGIAYHTLDAKGFLTGSGMVSRLLAMLSWAMRLRKLQPHTVIGFTHWPNLLCALSWRLAGATRCFWNQRSVDTALPVSKWEQWAMRMGVQYLSNGVAGASFIEARHGLEPEQVRIIPNLVGLPDLKERTGSVRGDVHLLMTANFYPEKDHDTVLRALRLLLNVVDALPVHLHLVGAAPGKSPQLHEAKAKAFDLGLCGKVTFHGSVSDMCPLLDLSHIGILSTRSEGVSNAVLEYMAHGLPVIATDITANREALGDQNAEWLFPVGDAEALADLLERMIHHADREAIGMANLDVCHGPAF
jgi:glycosyltransferase involved in cell wall biosynthesis